MKKSNHRRQYPLLLMLPFVLLVAGFELGPLLAMIKGSFLSDDGGRVTLEQYVTVFQSKYYVQGIRNSVMISLFSAGISIVVALFAAYSITRYSGKTRDRLLMIANMTSNFEGIPLSFSYIILLGNNGLFTMLFARWGWDVLAGFNLYSWTGLVLVYVYFQIPLAMLLVYPAFYGIQKEWREAASLLGATSFHFWRHIGVPVLLPSAAGTFSILFANAMGAYATAYALVGSNYNLISLQIASLVASDVALRPNLGSALGVLLASIMIATMLLNERLLRQWRRDLR